MTTKTMTRRSFTDDFKREAVSMLASSGRPLTPVATELGILPSMLRSWRDATQWAPERERHCREQRAAASVGRAAWHAGTERRAI
jgi:transposase-like protein